MHTTARRTGNADDLLPLASPVLARGVSAEFLDYNQVLPIAVQDGRLTLATPRAESDAAERLAEVLDAGGVDLVLVSPHDFELLRRRILGVAPSAPPLPEAPALALETLVDRAMAENASELLLEPGDPPCVRLRVDGASLDRTPSEWTRERHARLVSHLQSEGRTRPEPASGLHHGRMVVHRQGVAVSLDVRSLATTSGERVRMRLWQPRLPGEAADRPLGLPAGASRVLRRLLEAPSGIVLVVGPEGSGRSSTVRAACAIAAESSGRSVAVLDDVRAPLEAGRAQAAKATHIDALVEVSPDVLSVGDIDDAEAARAVVQASRRGRLVLATLHARDALEAIERLRELRVPASAIANEIIGVLALRLLPRTCPHCKGTPGEDPCARCRGRGTAGRVLLVETLEMTPPVARLVARNAPASDVRAAGLASGLRSFQSAALELVEAGVVSAENVRRLVRLRPLTMRCRPLGAEISAEGGHAGAEEPLEASGT